MQTQAGNTVVLESASFPGGTPTATDPVCLDQTTKLLQEHGLATPAELHQLREHGLAPPQGPRPPTPSAFYDLNESLLAECKRMMTPVLYAEESEVIGVGSINPVALRITAQIIMHTLAERTGTTPIVSRILLHHDGWMSLCQQQFGI